MRSISTQTPQQSCEYTQLAHQRYSSFLWQLHPQSLKALKEEPEPSPVLYYTLSLKHNSNWKYPNTSSLQSSSVPYYHYKNKSF